MKLKALILASVVVLAGLMGSEAYAAVTCPNGSLRDEATSYAECNLPDEEDGEGLMDRVQDIINVVIGVIGVVAVVVIIVGGVFYLISQGEAAKIARAKNTILYGIVGLVISMLAFAIVNFVLKSIL